jgi:hypothetical protein
MMSKRVLLLLYALWPAFAQLSSGADVTILSGTVSAGVTEIDPTAPPTGPYETIGSTITLGTTTLPSGALPSVDSNVTSSNGTQSTTSPSVTFLTGSVVSSSTTLGNQSTSISSSTSAPAPTNTQPCNGHPSFCARKYSNITMIAAHDSPFVKAGSASANQEYGVSIRTLEDLHWLAARDLLLTP